MSEILRRLLERLPVATPFLRHAAQVWLRTHRPRWVMDTNHRIDGKFTDARVERIFTACGYRAWTELIAGFRTTFAVPEEFKP